MRKNLIAALVTLGLGSAAAIAFIATTASAQSPGQRNPVMLAQARPPAPNNGNSNGRALNRPMPGPAARTARRAEFCQEAYARAAGRFAYLEARLGLSGAQSGAFNRWRDLRLVTAKRTATECGAPRNAGRGARGGNTAMPPSPVERLTREETRLQRRLADIQAERPALDALYTSLNVAQRRTLSREHGGFGRGGFGRNGGMGGPRGGMFGRGGPDGNGNMMFRRGPMDRGMRGGPGMMPPGNQPPPPSSPYPQ
jgi:hypothetical protein